MKVKVILEAGETPENSENLLFKALESQRTGEAHTEAFPDPAMAHVAEVLQTQHKTMWDEMMREIFEELDGEYE